MDISCRPYIQIYRWILLLLIVIIINAQSHVNDKCELSNGEEGTCQVIENCPSAFQIIKNKGKPDHCGFTGMQPIVCCGLQRNVGDISKRKCLEMNQPPVLLSIIREKTLPELINSENQPKKAELQSKVTHMTSEDIQIPIIVGGKDAEPFQFPHMAALGYGDEKNISWLCGGSLISEKYVLTAAHCINPHTGPVKHVRLGDLNLKQTTDDAKPQNFKVARTIIHPNYRAPSVYNDIALIELPANAIINNYVQPACLQTDIKIKEKKWGATGWGLTSFGGSASDHLQNVVLRPYSYEECQRIYATTSTRRLKNGIDFNTQICAGELNKDTCQGDSGGPLQVQSGDKAWGQHIIISVTSFGKACGLGNNPAVYTRVSYYIEWIESIVWPL